MLIPARSVPYQLLASALAVTLIAQSANKEPTIALNVPMDTTSFTRNTNAYSGVLSRMFSMPTLKPAQKAVAKVITSNTSTKHFLRTTI